MTGSGPRVLLTRPRADGEATARRLAALGYRAVLAPVLEVVPLAAALPAGPAPDALVLTSANGLLSPSPALLRLRDAVPLFAVGRASAAAAQAAGFADVRCADADAARLADLLVTSTPPGAVLLLLAGRPRKPDLEDAFAQGSRRMLAVETYEARPAAWDGQTVAGLHAYPPAAALHFSRRSASLTMQAAAAAGLRERFTRMLHVGLSDDVLAGLGGSAGLRLAVAAEPRTDSLLQALRRTLPTL